jgi:hypothetical protein
MAKKFLSAVENVREFHSTLHGVLLQNFLCVSSSMDCATRHSRSALISQEIMALTADGFLIVFDKIVGSFGFGSMGFFPVGAQQKRASKIL